MHRGVVWVISIFVALETYLLVDYVKKKKRSDWLMDLVKDSEEELA